MTPIRDYGNGVFAIDAHYERPLLASIHFIIDRDRVAIVDTASNRSIEPVLQALAQLGLGRENVDYVCLTHVHLDHAGGAGLYMREFAGAQLVVHRRGARHMIDPTKLMAGVKAVYGDAEAERLYGDLLPVAEERVIIADDGAQILVGQRPIVCLDTPGHARHHLCYHDPSAKAVFTGDVFGLSYREFDDGDRQSVFPTTSPVQFEPEAMHASIRRIMALEPNVLYLTHFSELREPKARAEDLHRLIDAHVAIARQANDNGADRHQTIVDGLWQLCFEEAQRGHWPVDHDKIHSVLGLDIELNAQGLEVWLDAQQAA